MKITLKNVRLAFPALWEPKAVQGSTAKKYSASLILPMDHPQLAEIRKMLKAAATEKWSNKGEAVYKTLEATGKLCLRNGDTKPEYEGFPGHMFISASSNVRPSVFDRDRATLTADSGKPYSGCYVNASIEIWAQDNQYGKRINAQLRGVQFFKDGDAFAGGGRPADENEFDDVSVDSTDDLSA